MSVTVNADGPRDAKLMVVGMAPEKNEVALGRPFVGPSGRILNEALKANGLPRERVFVTNISNEFLPAGASLFALPDLYSRHVPRLEAEIREVNPNCIFALGIEPMSILTGRSGIMKQAGSILPCVRPGLEHKKVVVSYHPAFIVRGMWKFLTVFQNIYTKRAVQESVFPELVYPKRNSLIGPSFNEAKDFLTQGLLSETQYVGFDIETMYWSKEKMGHIGCVGVGYTPDEAMCIPLMWTDGSSYWSPEEEIVIWQKLTSVLQSGKPKLAQNASFEWIYFWAHSIFPSNLWIDTMLLHHCLYPDFGGTDDHFQRKKIKDEPGHSLAFINSQYTKTPFYKDDGKNWDPKTGGGIEQWWRYNTTDVMVTNDSGEKMWKEAVYRKLDIFYREYYIRPFYHAVRAEWDGILMDVERMKQASKDAAEREEQLKELISRATGKATFNVKSTKDKVDLLYKQKGYQPKYNRKTKRITTDKYTIEYFANKYNDETLRLIIELSKVRDLRSKVLNQKLDARNRIHTHYKLGGTDGARWSSTQSILGNGTNLQNQDRDGIARKLFLAS